MAVCFGMNPKGDRGGLMYLDGVGADATLRPAGFGHDCSKLRAEFVSHQVEYVLVECPVPMDQETADLLGYVNDAVIGIEEDRGGLMSRSKSTMERFWVFFVAWGHYGLRRRRLGSRRSTNPRLGRRRPALAKSVVPFLVEFERSWMQGCSCARSKNPGRQGA